MRKIVFVLVASAAAFSFAPAYAEIIGGENITLSSSGFKFGAVPEAQFNLVYTPLGFFDTVSVATAGTAQVTSNSLFGPTVVDTFFPRNPMTFGPDSFGGYSSFPTLALISGSATPTDIGLRYSVGSDIFYGYARFTDTMLASYGFNTVANAPITAGAPIDRSIGGAVPESSTWGMVVVGFGMLGAALRSRTQKSWSVSNRAS